jgi:O-antigen/teichoic acid export membrane protein
LDSPKSAVVAGEHSADGTLVAPQPPSGKHTSLASNLAWRALANWSSQLVSWSALLVLVRLLSPKDFGLVGMSVVLYWYLKFLGEFGIMQTVIRHRDLSEETLAQLNTMGVVFGVGTFLLACLLAWPSARFFKTPAVVPVAIVTCMGLIPLGIRSVPEGLMSRDMRFKSLSLFDALRDIFSAIVTVLLAWAGFRYWSLVVGNLLSEFARCAIILSVQRHRYAWPKLATIKEPLTFGRRVLVTGFAWSTYNTLDNVTAGRVLGQAALGLYAMAWNLANMPLEKIVSLVTTMVPAYLSRVQTDLAALRHYVRNLSEMISLATFPTTIGMALVARDAVPLLMGRKWDGMIAPLQVLCVYAAVRSVVALLPKVLTAFGHAKFVMRVEVSGLVMMPIAFWIGSHWGIRGIAYGWVFAYPIIAVAEYLKTMKSIEMRAGEYFRSLRPALDGSIAMALAVGLLQWKLPAGVSPWPRLIIEIGGGAVVYLATLALLHRDRAVHFLSIVKRMRGPKLEAQPGVAGS